MSTYYVIDGTDSINDTAAGAQGAVALDAGDNLLVQSTGSVLATGVNSIGVYLDANGAGDTITVNGLVVGTDIGIYAIASNAHIYVNGEVEGGNDAAISAGQGMDTQITIGSTGNVFGEVDVLGQYDQLINAGTIASTNNQAIDLGAAGVTNNGLITSTGTAIEFQGSANGDVINTGTIEGSLQSNVELGTGGLNINNSGLWDGGLALPKGANIVTNSGTITGGINGGVSNDIIDSSNGHVYGQINGGAGNDTITGGSENNLIDGGAGADIINGGGGINTASYTDSQASVYIDLTNGIAKHGDAAGDQLSNIQNLNGTLYKDTLIGDANNNVLNGLTGSDTLNGNDGNDTLIEYGSGHAVISGGNGNDLIQLLTLDVTDYGKAFSAGDQIDGGSGFNTVELQGEYNVTFTPTTMVNVQNIVLDPNYDYTLTTSDATVAAGQTLTIDGSQLGASDKLVFNGSAETNGNFVVEGGAARDTFTGGSGNDTFIGGGNGDTITAGAGNDTFAYHGVSDSTGTHYDSIAGFNAAHDLFNLDVAVAHVDAAVNGVSISSASLNTDLTTALSGHLNAGDAILVTASSGTLSGHEFLVIDANGTAGYQSNLDYVMDVTGMTGTLTTSDFIMT